MIDRMNESLDRHLARAKLMLAEEEQKAEALLRSPECGQAIAEQEERIKHAKKNLAQVEKVRKRFQKRAREAIQ